MIELLITMLVIAILAAIAIPIFVTSLDEARAGTVRAALANARLSITLVVTERDALPVGAERLDILRASGNDAITLTLDGTAAQFCLSGAHDGVAETWASTRQIGPTRGASCAADGTMIMP